MDEIDPSTGDTPFHTAIEYVYKDLEFFMILHRAQCDVNGVNNKTMTPLQKLDEKLKLDPSDDALANLRGFLVSIGAVTDWRKAV